MKSSSLLLRVLILLTSSLKNCHTLVSSSSSYPNVTLTSKEIAVTIYLPSSLSSTTEKTNGNKKQAYYEGSRFEHGSMIGSIVTLKKKHSLYGTDTWRLPHDPSWPESGVGLASEFGVGDNGDFCPYRCGWYGVNNVTNGVLGYGQARHGEAFLKIGVGALVKGSCEECDSTGIYMFNSPYKFAAEPIWTMSQPSVGTISMQHEAHVKQYGYSIQKQITLDGNNLYVTTTLTNLGTEAFSTAWYSHHFFSCDGRSIGPGYEVEMDLRASRYPIGSAIRGDGGMAGLYEEPGVLFMRTKELRNYAKVKRSDTSVRVSMNHPVEEGTRIKAEFVKDEGTSGSFGLKACGTWIGEDIPQVKDKDNGVSMYGFNLYMEKGILSPEPQILISLQPSQSKSWTQRLVFRDADEDVPPLTEIMRAAPQTGAAILRNPATGSSSSNSQHHHRHHATIYSILPGFLVVAAMIAMTILTILTLRQQQRRYFPIPDAELTV